VSSLTTDQGIVHYEVYGRGKPVILLHGWLGSWGMWQDTMTYLGHTCRTYALDFWGFGESGKKRATYAVQDFVSLVDQFMEQLGILRAPLVGHSMGGTVSLSVAIQYPDRVTKVVVIGSPIVGSSLTLMPTLASYKPVAVMVYNAMGLLKLGLRLAAPTITRDRRWSSMISRDLSRTTLESFLLSIASLRQTDLLPSLSRIQVPVMGMYGHKDNIVKPDQWQPLLAGVPHARIERYPDCGHFPMLDQPQRFMATLGSFLNAESVTP
jgi:pimeloyl-ACP methyl ester carboxylesterase